MMSQSVLPNVEDLTLSEKVGQMLCLGWSAPECLLNVNEQARRCVLELHAGGLVVMGRNLSPNARPRHGEAVAELPPIDAPAVRTTLAELQALARIPLLLPTDQEGGRVARFGTTPFTRMPDALTVGQHNNPEWAKEAAFVTAQELAAVGVNWNFAPVADVNSHPENPVIGDRAFGATVEAVVPMVRAQVEGYQAGGVLACAKHFPGHGDTALDSHFDLPVLPFDLPQMQARELVSFVAAIDAGVATIMTAHILFPALDTDRPATMSAAILTGLLRETLKFEGLIVTDCLEMRAVADRWGTARAAVEAAKSGADMLLVCHTWERQKETFDALVNAVEAGELPESRVNTAVERVLAAKRRVLSQTRPSLDVIGTEANRAIRERFATPATETPTTLGANAPMR